MNPASALLRVTTPSSSHSCSTRLKVWLCSAHPKYSVTHVSVLLHKLSTQHLFIMPKRKHTDASLDVINEIFAAIGSEIDLDLSKGTSVSSQVTKYLNSLKSQILAEGEKKAATEFTLVDNVVQEFNLTYTAEFPGSMNHFWRIEDLPETKNFVHTMFR